MTSTIHNILQDMKCTQPGEAELFETLVLMACPPKPRRRRVQAAKREGLDVPAACLRATHRQAFLEELLDACVLAASKAQIISEGNRAQPGSLYFPDEALEKDLQFITPVSVLLDNVAAASSRCKSGRDAASTLNSIREFIGHCTARNLGEKLNRLSACGDAQAGLEAASLSACDAQAGPDLFAVIKQEGTV